MDADTLVNWIRFWRALIPPAHVVLIHMRDEDDLILACMENGIRAYILQGASISSLLALLALAHQDQVYCMPHKARQLCAALARCHVRTTQSPQRPPALTARELEILHYLAQDRTNLEIADLLVIEIGTVKHHVHNILEKLSVRHRWEAARVAVEQGWVQQNDLGGCDRAAGEAWVPPR
jgi:DNA-binding NarL/FixJ family response regulator